MAIGRHKKVRIKGKKKDWWKNVGYKYKKEKDDTKERAIQEAGEEKVSIKRMTGRTTGAKQNTGKVRMMHEVRDL